MPDMLKHDHEHVPYFPTKNCWRSSSSRYGSQFLNRTYCVVPRWKWTKLRGLTLPQWLPTGALQDSTWPFSSTGHLLETTRKALSIEPQFSQQIFVGRSTELMMPELW